MAHSYLHKTNKKIKVKMVEKKKKVQKKLGSINKKDWADNPNPLVITCRCSIITKVQKRVKCQSQSKTPSEIPKFSIISISHTICCIWSPRNWTKKHNIWYRSENERFGKGVILPNCLILNFSLSYHQSPNPYYLTIIYLEQSPHHIPCPWRTLWCHPT